MGSSIEPSEQGPTSAGRHRYVPVIGPRLRTLLRLLLGLFAVLCVNSIYLVTISVTQRATGRTYENYFYQWMFLLHLVLGLAIIAPVVLEMAQVK